MTSLAEMGQLAQGPWSWGVRDGEPSSSSHSWDTKLENERFHIQGKLPPGKQEVALPPPKTPVHPTQFPPPCNCLNQCGLRARVQGEAEPHVCMLDEPLLAAEDGGGIPEAYMMLCM